MNRGFVIKAAHQHGEKTLWVEVGRLTMLDSAHGVMRLNHVPGVTYQVFRDDKDKRGGEGESGDG